MWFIHQCQSVKHQFADSDNNPSGRPVHQIVPKVNFLLWLRAHISLVLVGGGHCAGLSMPLGAGLMCAIAGRCTMCSQYSSKKRKLYSRGNTSPGQKIKAGAFVPDTTERTAGHPCRERRLPPRAPRKAGPSTIGVRRFYLP